MDKKNLTMFDLSILLIMVLRGTEEQREEAFNILGPNKYREIIRAGRENEIT